MSDKNIIKGNENITAGGNLSISTTYTASQLYLFDVQVMADIVNSIYNADAELTPLNDFTTVDNIEIKNQLNGVDDGFFNEIIKPYYGEFKQLDDFFKNPINKDITKKYKSILTEVKGRIYSEICAGKKLQDILPILFDYAKQSDPNLFLDDKLHYLNLLAYYMYANCDIGKKQW